MKHPEERQLALLAGGDTGWWEGLWLQIHLRSCVQCRERLTGLRRVRRLLASSGRELPEGVDWARLAGEMAANIRLGLEAGECVGTVHNRSPQTYCWRWAAVGGAIILLLTAAWWLNIPPGARKAADEAGPVVEYRMDGIELRSGGSSFVLRHDRADASSTPVFTSAPDGLRVRFVDVETGQITVHHVYAQ